MRAASVMFDLHGTLAYIANRVRPEDASSLLVMRGYEIYPQTWKAALDFVSMVDYPRDGCSSFHHLISRALKRLEIECDAKTASLLAALHEKEEWKLFDDAASALKRVHGMGIRTAIVTTIPVFRFRRAISVIMPYLDMVVDGHTFRCEKSNPRIYTETARALAVAPEDTVMIGDEELTDVTVPESVSLRGVLLDRTGQGKRATPAMTVVASLDELADMLERQG